MSATFRRASWMWMHKQALLRAPLIFYGPPERLPKGPPIPVKSSRARGWSRYATALERFTRGVASANEIGLTMVQERRLLSHAQSTFPTPTRRRSRAQDKPGRVARRLDDRERDFALAQLETRPVRKAILDRCAGGRGEWAAEVWFELVSPPANVAVAPDFRVRLDRAVWRAERRIEKLSARKVARAVLLY